MHRTSIVLLLGLILLSFTSGCSSFHREWRCAGKVEPQGFTGRWEGTWHSDANGHNDKLRCIIKPGNSGTYQVTFHAKYQKIFSFGYTALFVGEMKGETFHFSGEADLGKLAGGIYRYEGNVNNTNFFSTYKSKYDHGTFQMQRPTSK